MASNKIISAIPHCRDWKRKEETGFPKFRKEAISAAKQLCYSSEVVSDLKMAETTEQVNKIMYRARAEWICTDDIEAASRGKNRSKKGKK